MKLFGNYGLEDLRQAFQGYFSFGKDYLILYHVKLKLNEDHSVTWEYINKEKKNA